MLKKVIFSMVILAGLNACTYHYTDSAPAPDGGRFVSGDYDTKAAVFYCPSDKEQGECEQITVELD